MSAWRMDYDAASCNTLGCATAAYGGEVSPGKQASEIAAAQRVEDASGRNRTGRSEIRAGYFLLLNVAENFRANSHFMLYSNHRFALILPAGRRLQQ